MLEGLMIHHKYDESSILQASIIKSISWGTTYLSNSTRLPHKDFDFDSGELTKDHANEPRTGSSSALKIGLVLSWLGVQTA
ncbi:hypothetical protein TNCV_1771341 [Trichonephila clavipes]|nr:hypothetical protein TNCV_1771341 [Trichonephila clavipes]